MPIDLIGDYNECVETFVENGYLVGVLTIRGYRYTYKKKLKWYHRLLDLDTFSGLWHIDMCREYDRMSFIIEREYEDETK